MTGEENHGEVGRRIRKQGIAAIGVAVPLLKRATLRTRGNGHRALIAASLGTARERAALEAGLSVPMVAWARRILKHGTKELIAAVEDGRIALYMAARVARWSPEAQRELLATVSVEGSDTITPIRSRSGVKRFTWSHTTHPPPAP